MTDSDEDQTMDLTIEALTGTIYDLCVSPYETILGIKMKIQRLEGIPVYQQQLVYGDTELIDENCLAEHGVPPGAQLKLLIAMRGGPIHAQRVHVDLEDPSMMEIAEFLDSEAGERYTVMLVKNKEEVDTSNYIHVQMLNEDSRGSISCSPIPLTGSSQRVGVITNKATQMEHEVTRDKMKDLMAKMKKGRSYRHYPLPPMTGRGGGGTAAVMAATKPVAPSTQLQRKATTKVLILESRASSRLLQTSSCNSPLPNENTRLSGAQRKLVFSGSHCSCCQHSSSIGRQSIKTVASKRTRSPEVDTPTSSPWRYSRLHDEVYREQGRDHSTHHRGNKESWKASKRVRRNSLIASDNKHTESNDSADRAVGGVSSLDTQLSQLSLSERNPTDLHLNQLDNNIRVSDERVTCTSRRNGKSTGEHLPHLPSGHKPVSLTSRPWIERGSTHKLPPLSVTAVTSTAKTGTSSRRSRCMHCGKRTGLATSYKCRCGGMYCALHRYAEMHTCSFDYKTEGRRSIARDNPVVMAPKLPKI